jgi:quinol monooxygenase YgiN
VVVLIAVYRGRAGAGDTIEPLLRELATRSREEPGCVQYLVHRSTSTPDTFVLYEQYDDDAAIAAHRSSAHFQELAVGQIIPQLEIREVDTYHLLGP